MDNEKKLIMPDDSFFIDKDAFPEKLPQDVLQHFFQWLGAEPYYTSCNGEEVLMLKGLCHHSHSGSHSVICNSKGKCKCFSLCGDGFYWWNFAARFWNVDSTEAKNRIKDWLDRNNYDITPEDIEDDFVQLPYEPIHIEPLPFIGNQLLQKWYQRFDQRPSTMNRLRWHTEDGIKVSTMLNYGVAYYPERGTIILPHHNVNGEVVGIYERSFLPLKREMKEKFPEMTWEQLAEYPAAKYKPLYDPELKASLSFKNSHNLYGLHKSKREIQRTGKAIVVEGGKSVMLLDQWGYKNAVAPHTFGINENHVSMLIEAGAKEIILGFDKQYQTTESYEWDLYRRKNLQIAERVKGFVKISYIPDPENLLDYKDAPVDKGEEIFRYLLENREALN